MSREVGKGEVAYWGEAVASTALAKHVAVQPDLAAAVRASNDLGIGVEFAQWWARIGQVRVVGHLRDTLECDGEDATCAAMAVLHAVIACGTAIGDVHEAVVADWAARALCWEAGRVGRDVSVLVDGGEWRVPE